MGKPTRLRRLRIGDRVRYPGEADDLGTVVAGALVHRRVRYRVITSRILTVLWDGFGGQIRAVDEVTLSGILVGGALPGDKVRRVAGGRWSAERCRVELTKAQAEWDAAGKPKELVATTG